MKKLIFIMLLASFNSFAQQKILSKWYAEKSSSELKEGYIITFYTVDNDDLCMAWGTKENPSKVYGFMEIFSNTEEKDVNIWSYVWRTTDGNSYKSMKVTLYIKNGFDVFSMTIVNPKNGEYVIYNGIKIE